MSNVTQIALGVVTRVRVGADVLVRPASEASVQALWNCNDLPTHLQSSLRAFAAQPRTRRPGLHVGSGDQRDIRDPGRPEHFSVTLNLRRWP
jgi:hypothetical protein